MHADLFIQDLAIIMMAAGVVTVYPGRIHDRSEYPAVFPDP